MIATKTAFPCSICGTPTEASLAVLEVDPGVALRRGREWADWEKAHTDEFGLTRASGRDLAEAPERVEWEWNHRTCGPEGKYWISIDRIDTPSKALGWTLHLMGKVWFEHTEWESWMRQLGFVEDD